MQKLVSKAICKDKQNNGISPLFRTQETILTQMNAFFSFFYQFTKNFVQCIMVIVTFFHSLKLPSPFSRPQMLNFVSYFIFKMSKCYFMSLRSVVFTREWSTHPKHVQRKRTPFSKYLSASSSSLCKREILSSLPYEFQIFVYTEAVQVLCILLFCFSFCEFVYASALLFL